MPHGVFSTVQVHPNDPGGLFLALRDNQDFCDSIGLQASHCSLEETLAHPTVQSVLRAYKQAKEDNNPLEVR